jgi:two-component system, OmpR family, heavy metal sensor histidine kinase CusS
LKTVVERVSRTLSRSIAVRLAAGFIVVVLGALAGIGCYLDHALQSELQEADMHGLAGKLAVIRHNLGETRSPEALRAEFQRYAGMSVGYKTLSVALRDASGVILASGGDHVTDALEAAGPPAPGSPDRTYAVERSDLGLRVLAGEVRLGDAANRVIEAVIALEVTDRRAITARYRAHTVLAVAIAALAAGLLGILVARAGLAPVQALAHRAGSISVSHLDKRLPVEDVPTELRELTDAFNRTLQRLDESFRRLSQFSADLAHDLRTPLGNLLGEAQVALSRPRSVEEYQAVLASSVEELERIHRMIDAMLFLARTDNVQASLNPQAFDAGAEVDRVAEYYEAVAAEAGVRIARAGELTVHADRALFQRAVANLVSNAIAHTPPGGEIRCTLRDGPEGSAEIAVSNPGAGIPPELLGRVFDRFFRCDESRLDSAKGSGLGLAIVKSIMQVHGGRVEAQSEPGKLTVFRLIFGRPTVRAAGSGRDLATAPATVQAGSVG